MPVQLRCTVRDCGERLSAAAGRLVCPKSHSFDIARAGYINLLQPQDRRSLNPGDQPDAVAARRRLHDSGATRPLLEGVRETLGVHSGPMLDAGCGEGFYLGELAGRHGVEAHGVDISVPAITAAAKRYPDCSWVVANADRFLPFEDSAFSTVLSITGRMNPDEFLRVLHGAGRLLVAVAAPEDLIELRGRGRNRADRTVELFSRHFTLAGQRNVTSTSEMTPEQVFDVRKAIYRPIGAGDSGPLRITFSLDLLLFEPRKAG